MSLPPHRQSKIQNQWLFQIQNEADLNLYSDVPAGPEYTRLTESYGPFIFLPSVAGYTPLDQAINTKPYDPSSGDDFEYPSARVSLYDGLVGEHPAIAMDVSDMLNSSNSGENKRALPVHASFPDSMSLSVIGVESPAVGNSGNFTSPPTTTRVSSTSRKGRSYNHYCAECGAPFDRASRARDCANKDLDQKPYACKNRCKKRNCNAAYSSEKLLNEHLDERRFMDCRQCGRRLTKKNIARHMQEACY